MSGKWTISKDGQFWTITDDKDAIRFRGKTVGIVLKHLAFALQAVDKLNRCRTASINLIDAILACDDDLIDKRAAECREILEETDPEIESDDSEEEDE